MKQEQMFNIDVVITWVDGNDPELGAKRAQYMQGNDSLQADDIAGTTRYSDRGEIYWCVRSINKFMPWVHRIFIVTDGQDPKVESEIPVEIVDHKVIFRGYEHYLPTFNSLSIEAMLWRIPELSEHFVYFNDDFMICKKVNKDMFFPKEGYIKCHGHKASLLWTKIRYFFKRLMGHACRVNHVQQMMDSADIVGGSNSFIRLSHTPYPLLKSTLQGFYESHPSLLAQNICNRFRSREHFRSDELVYMLLRKEGKLQVMPERDVLMEYMPHGGMERLERKLHRVTCPGSHVCFINFGSLDKASDDIFSRITQFVEELLKQ
ncbi:MAG: Stealth CR1 domain-containing protein [Bacteroidaceae bacterium]|nr:Stealth CR1 domain-containing protein [Bacteroidaceae bacterium]